MAVVEAKKPTPLRPYFSPWVAALTLLALYVTPLSPVQAERAMLGVPLDRWHQSLQLALAVYSGWHLLFALVSVLQRGSVLTETTLDDDLMAVLLRRTRDARGWHRSFLYLAMLWVSSRPLGLSASRPGLEAAVDKGVRAVAGFWALELAWELLAVLLTHLLSAKPAGDDDDEEGAGGRAARGGAAVRSILGFVRPIYFLGGALAIADNIGIEVGPLVASLSLGGLAVAMSTKLVLEDLTAGLALLVERPFSVGDCISVGGGPSASVLSVGVKSTVLRTSGGDVLVVGNKDLASGRITKYPPLADRSRTLTVWVSAASLVGGGAAARVPLVAQDVAQALSSKLARADGHEQQQQPEGGGGKDDDTLPLPEVVVDSVLLAGDVGSSGSAQVEVRYRCLGCSAAMARTAHHHVTVATLASLQTHGIALAPPPQSSAS